MSRTAKPTLVMTIQPEERYTVRELVARFTYISDDGELLNPLSNSYGKPFEELADLCVSTYVNNEGDQPYFYGETVSYRGLQVELKQAEMHIKVLRKIEKGLNAARDAEGYLSNSDFHTFLLRVGKILGVSEYRVRNTREMRNMTGEFHRRVDGQGLQYYVNNVSHDLAKAIASS